MLAEDVFQTESEVDTRIDELFLARILSPYKPTDTDYLKSVSIKHSCFEYHDQVLGSIFSTQGEFNIPSSCYIRDTGHFNAVEFLICFNQLAYATFGQLFRGNYFRDHQLPQLSSRCNEALAKVDLELFFKKQLSSMLILRTQTRFKGVINANKFSGMLSVNSFKFKRNTLFTDTSCMFSDENGGYAEGEVSLAYPLNFAD